MLNALKELIAIPSITGSPPLPGMPFGQGVHDALEKALEICAGLGFRTEKCGEYLGYAEIGQGAEMMAILAHLDVVPPGGGWSRDPFGGEISEGKIYGRGVMDDKGPAISAIFAMKDILDSGKPLDRRVRLIFGCQEEGGSWPDMAYYKAHEELPVFGFTPDSCFPAVYAEKGILQVSVSMAAKDSGFAEIAGGDAVNMVAGWARAVLKDGTALTEQGRPAHGSLPQEGENAITRLMEKAASRNCPFAEFYMEKIGRCLDGSSFGIGFHDQESGSLTMNAGTVYIDDDRVTLNLDIRYPVTCTADQIMDNLRKAAAPYGLTVIRGKHMPPVYMDSGGPVITRLMDAYREVTGDTAPPSVRGGGTYARAMDNIIAFGARFPGTENTEHQPDECVPIADLEKAREIYRRAIEKLACGVLPRE